MSFYKLIVECGHMGAGRGFEEVRYIKSRDAVAAIQLARRLPGVKKKDSTLAVKLIKEVTRAEYLGAILSRSKERTAQ